MGRQELARIRRCRKLSDFPQSLDCQDGSGEQVETVLPVEILIDGAASLVLR